MDKRVFIVESQYSGERLDVFLAHETDGVSRSQIQKLIEQGTVLLNGKPAQKRVSVKENDQVEIDEINKIGAVSELAPQDIPLEILYEDEYFVAVNKQPGLVVHPGCGVSDGTLVNALLYHVKTLSEGSAVDRPGIVHRLDKDTSGVIIVAKTNSAHVALSEYFMERKIEKYYVGLCIGMPEETHSLIDIPLGRSVNDPIKRSPRISGGKPAQTEYWVLGYQDGISAIKFNLHTGRTHQIRVHCSVKGFPILADLLYGGTRERLQRISPLERPFAYSIYKCFNRQALHARSLTFVHPFTKKKVEIIAPLPNDFINAIGKFDNKDLIN